MIAKETVFLVVDNTETMRHITTSLVRDNIHGTHLLGAEDGQQALEILEKQQVDIVLSEYDMPMMSGLELLKAMRRNPRLARIPFIMITGEADRRHVTEAVAAGVSALVIKPYNSAQLLEHIEKVMARQRLAGQPNVANKPATAAR